MKQMHAYNIPFDSINSQVSWQSNGLEFNEAQYSTDRKYQDTSWLVAKATGGHIGIQTGKWSDQDIGVSLVSLTIKGS